MKIFRVLFITFLLSLTFSSVFALTNRDFETGDFTGWGSWTTEGVHVVSSPSPMDNYSAIINGSQFTTAFNGGFGQDVVTAYNISFYCKGSFNSTGDVNGKLIVRTDEWSQGYGDDISTWCNSSTWQHIELIPTNSSTSSVEFMLDGVTNYPNPRGNWFMIDNVTVCGDGDCQGGETEGNCPEDCYTTTTIGQFEETFTDLGQGTGSFLRSMTLPLANIILGLGVIGGVMFIIYALSTIIGNSISGKNNKY